jgi:hypothetical protein
MQQLPVESPEETLRKFASKALKQWEEVSDISIFTHEES